MIKNILSVISLFFCLSQALASDLDLKGTWIRLGFTCRLSDGSFKMLGAQTFIYHALTFKENNQVMEISGFADCKVVTTGIYSVDGNRLNISLESNSARTLHSDSSCTVVPVVGRKSIFYDEIILKDSSLYLKEFTPSNFFTKRCPNGTVFEQLIRITIIDGGDFKKE